MTLDELKQKMKEINECSRNDYEACHVELDELLLKFINDDEVTALFNEKTKWYA